jgi:hypothetical protein
MYISMPHCDWYVHVVWVHHRRNLSSEEDVLCRQRTYEVLCGDAIRSLLGIQADELFNYGLEIGEEQLHAARYASMLLMCCAHI